MHYVNGRIVYTTQKEIRRLFKEQCSDYKRNKKHNEQNDTVRTEFSFFINSLRRDGLISEKLACRATM
jgi:thermostable 8-oxoguanine DNA glycosylase